MDTKERRTDVRAHRPAPVPDPIWHPAHRSRGEKSIRKTASGFNREQEKIRSGDGRDWRFPGATASRGVCECQPPEPGLGFVPQAQKAIAIVDRKPTGRH